MQLQSIVFSTTGYVHSSTPYYPRGVPIFPNRPANKTKGTEKIGSKARNKRVKHDEKCSEGNHTGKTSPYPSLQTSCHFQGSKVPKSGSGEPELVSSAPSIMESSSLSKQRQVEWHKPIARRKQQIGRVFLGGIMKLAVWMSPVADRRSIARSVTRREQSQRRWCDEFRLSPHGHGSAVMLGGESEGDRLQKTLHMVRVSAQLTPCKWSGNLKEGRERGSLSFHRLRNSFRAWARSHVLVVTAKQQGAVPDAPDLARKSALSLPRMPQCAGQQTVETCQPRSWWSLMTLRVWRAYS